LGVLEDSAGAALAHDWNAEKNDRRCDLIDKEIEGTITALERGELALLQSQALAYRDLVAPPPMAGALALHRELLAKKRQARDAQ
jgi:hypothetical protein